MNDPPAEIPADVDLTRVDRPAVGHTPNHRLHEPHVRSLVVTGTGDRAVVPRLPDPPVASDLRAVHLVLTAGSNRRHDDPTVGRKLVDAGLVGKAQLRLHRSGERHEQWARLVEVLGKKDVELSIDALGREAFVEALFRHERTRARPFESARPVRGGARRRVVAAADRAGHHHQPDDDPRHSPHAVHVSPARKRGKRAQGASPPTSTSSTIGRNTSKATAPRRASNGPAPSTATTNGAGSSGAPSQRRG